MIFSDSVRKLRLGFSSLGMAVALQTKTPRWLPFSRRAVIECAIIFAGAAIAWRFVSTIRADARLYLDAFPGTLLMSAVGAFGALAFSFLLAAASSTSKGVLRQGVIIFASITNFVPLLLLAPVLSSVYGDSGPLLLAICAGIFPAYSILSARLNERLPALNMVLRSLGANRSQLFLLITIPRVKAALLSAAALTFPSAVLGTLIGEMALGSRTGNLIASFAWQGDLKRIAGLTLLTTMLSALPTLFFRYLARRYDHGVTQSNHSGANEPPISLARSLAGLSTMLAWIFVFWMILSTCVDVPWFVPSPFRFVERIFAHGSESVSALTGGMARTIAVTVIGAVLATLAALLVVLANRTSHFSGVVLQTLTLVTETTPIIVFIPSIALFLGREWTAEILVVVLASFFPLYATLLFGTNSVSRQALLTVNSLSSSIWDEYRFVRFPAAFPYLLAAIETVVPKMVLGALLGQYLITREGIGQYVYAARGRLDFSGIWLTILVLAIFSSATVLLVRRIAASVGSRRATC